MPTRDSPATQRRSPAVSRIEICASGFLGAMVPYGEDDAELYSTIAEAKSKRADYDVHIGLPLTIKLLEALSRYSAQPVRVEGIFDFDQRCWPQTTGGRPDICFPPRPMRVGRARVFLGDGTYEMMLSLALNGQDHEQRKWMQRIVPERRRVIDRKRRGGKSRCGQRKYGETPPPLPPTPQAPHGNTVSDTWTRRPSAS